MSVPTPLPGYKISKAGSPQRDSNAQERPQPGRPGTLLSAELLPSLGAQRLQVEVDAVLGAQDQLGQLDGQPQGVHREFKAEQAQGCDHLHLIHGELLPDAVPAESRVGRKRCLQRGCFSDSLMRYRSNKGEVPSKAAFSYSMPWELRDF